MLGHCAHSGNLNKQLGIWKGKKTFIPGLGGAEEGFPEFAGQVNWLSLGP